MGLTGDDFSVLQGGPTGSCLLNWPVYEDAPFWRKIVAWIRSSHMLPKPDCSVFNYLLAQPGSVVDLMGKVQLHLRSCAPFTQIHFGPQHLKLLRNVGQTYSIIGNFERAVANLHKQLYLLVNFVPSLFTEFCDSVTADTLLASLPQTCTLTEATFFLRQHVHGAIHRIAGDLKNTRSSRPGFHNRFDEVMDALAHWRKVEEEPDRLGAINRIKEEMADLYSMAVDSLEGQHTQFHNLLGDHESVTSAAKKISHLRALKSRQYENQLEGLSDPALMRGIYESNLPQTCVANALGAAAPRASCSRPSGLPQVTPAP
jgi:hypothetical protein